MSTDAERIAAAENAMDKAVHAAEYQQPDGTRVRRQSLADLREHAAALKADAAMKERGGMYVPVGGFGVRI